MMNSLEHLNVQVLNTQAIKETQGGLAFIGAGALASVAVATYLASSVVAFTHMGND